MIGDRSGPPQRREFEQRWGSPFGYRSVARRALFKIGQQLNWLSLQGRAIGPFGFQSNNATRAFEYPWAFHAVPVGVGHTVIDLGGSLGGLQFVLAATGAKVINVDPSDTASMGWPVDAHSIAQLNKAFGTSVELRKVFLQDAGLEAESIDRIYCISTLEHIPLAEIPALAAEMNRVLKRGGFVVLTVDLFYDLAPFTQRESNMWGRNVDIRWFVDCTGLELYQGERTELFGYPEFEPQEILSRAMEFTQGNGALNTAQAFVLHKG